MGQYAVINVNQMGRLVIRLIEANHPEGAVMGAGQFIEPESIVAVSNNVPSGIGFGGAYLKEVKARIIPPEPEVRRVGVIIGRDLDGSDLRKRIR